MTMPMPIVQDIRRLDRQGLSRAQISRRLHVDRGTVAIVTRIWRIARPSRRRIAGTGRRSTRTRIWWTSGWRRIGCCPGSSVTRSGACTTVCWQTDHDGEYSTTMRYARRWREANRGMPDREGHVRLEWAAAGKQVDFGMARARIAGEMADVHCLVVSLPYLNMRLCVALPGENAECLCHGLMLVFEHIGGVPPVIVLDNATGAGRRNVKGEVALTGCSPRSWRITGSRSGSATRTRATRRAAWRTRSGFCDVISWCRPCTRNPRHTGVDERLVLEEVRMPPRALTGVMHRADGLAAPRIGTTEARAHLETDRDVQLLPAVLRIPEIHGLDLPRRLQLQGGGEQVRGIHAPNLPDRYHQTDPPPTTHHKQRKAFFIYCFINKCMSRCIMVCGFAAPNVGAFGDGRRFADVTPRTEDPS